MSDDKLPKWVKPLLEFGPVIAFFVAYMRMKETVYTIAESDYQGFIVVTALFVPLLLICTAVLRKLTGNHCDDCDSSSSCSTLNGIGFGIMPASGAFCCSETSPSSWHTIAPMCGPNHTCSSWTRMASHNVWPACHRIISRRKASTGATRSMTGTRWQRTTMHGGCRVWTPRGVSSI